MSFRTKIGGMVRGFQDAGCFGKNNGIRDISGKHLWNMRYLEQVKRDINEGIVKFCICGIRKFNRIWDTRGKGALPIMEPQKSTVTFEFRLRVVPLTELR